MLKSTPFRLISASLLFCLTVVSVLLLDVWADHAIAQSLIPTKLSPEQANQVLMMERRLETEFEDHFAQDLAEVTQSPAEIAATLTELNTATGTNAAVFWAIPNPEFLHLVLVTPDGETLMLDRFDVPRATLDTKVRQFRRQLFRPGNSQRVIQVAQELYDWLLKPFEADYLEAKGVDQILFCLGDGLRGVPMSALHDGKQFILEKYSTSLIPAFNLIQTDYQPTQDRNILAMGASEFINQSPLPAVPVELATIEKAANSTTANTTAAWKTRSLLNKDFTIETLDELLDDQSFNIVHLATHATFSAGHPRESYIQFQNERLSLHQMDQLHWNEPPIDLLILSACETALGSAEAELGFAGMALKAGVKSALASLWTVSDSGTLALMAEFYHQLPNAPTKAEALRQTQLQLLHGDVAFTETALRLPSGNILLPETLQGQTPDDLSHPFFWAGFTMLSHPW